MWTIGFIGGGNMAEALIKGIIVGDLYRPEQILVSDVDASRLDYLSAAYEVGSLADNSSVARQADILILAVKPQLISEVTAGIGKDLKKRALVISIAAGTPIAKLEEFLKDVPIVRVMPNTPALIGAGASALCANDKAKKRLNEAKSIFEAVGEAVVIDKEELMDVVTAVSGSGPAYFFLLAEEMIKAGTELGLEEETARKLVLQTARGAAMLAVQADAEGQSPAQLREKVTSPGGTTEAALEELSSNEFGKLIDGAVRRAFERGRELSDE